MNNVFFIKCDAQGLSRKQRRSDSARHFDRILDDAANNTYKSWENNDYYEIRHFNKAPTIHTLRVESPDQIEISNLDDFTICINAHHDYAQGIKSSTDELKKTYNIEAFGRHLFDHLLCFAKPTAHIDIILMMCEGSAYDKNPQESTTYKLAEVIRKYQRKREGKNYFSFSVKGLCEDMMQTKDGIAVANYRFNEGSTKRMVLMKKEKRNNGEQQKTNNLFMSVSSPDPDYPLRIRKNIEFFLYDTNKPVRGGRTLRFDVERFNRDITSI